ncbi:hypothetical protein BDR06DRAFT_188094 [Suillus hirtellus]|nr:hypothetical protein BDR06DRAFT_188094 [Suillus hirtellus]
MNTQAPAARYVCFFLSTNERGRHLSPANTHGTQLPLSSYSEPPSSRKTPYVQTLSSSTGCHSFQRLSHIPTCSRLLSDVSRINHLEDRAHLLCKISDITAQLDGYREERNSVICNFVVYTRVPVPVPV